MQTVLTFFSEAPSRTKLYFLLLFLHVVLGGLLFVTPAIGSYYGILVVTSGFFLILRNKNRNHEVLQVAGYLIGSEVLLRMTNGFLNYEFVKYVMVILAGIGIYYDGFSRRSLPYWIYLLALVPSLIFEKDLAALTRSAFNGIVFDLSGPICLGAMAIYTFDKKLTLTELHRVIIAMGLPILSCGVYVFLFSPPVDSYLRGVSSNSMFSGGFGPNQVATLLGLGMFVFFMQFVVGMQKKVLSTINLSISAFLCYVGLMTFSRGGMITGLAICVVFLGSVYYFSGTFGKTIAKKGAVYFMLCLIMVVGLIYYQTNGLIINRYTNRDHRGNVLKERNFDRKELAEKQIKIFMENPVLGTGPGERIKIQKAKEVKQFASHDEITRLLANHGISGLLNVLILIFTPLVLFFKTRHNVYLAVFFAFWFLSINHSGMRTAAPAFLYALTLFRVDVGRNSFFRKPLSQGL